MTPAPADPHLRIAVLAAGAGGMYCGSCLRDNALSLALRQAGHHAVMIPLYTPVKTDTPAATGDAQVFYGGINTFLQHVSRIFRWTPRFLDWLFDRPWLLRWAGSRGAQTSPAKLGQFTLDILRGEDGHTGKELHRLAAYLRDKVRPQVVSLPNLMFIGAARTLRRQTGAAVIVECTGEDIFLDAMAQPHQSQARDLIRAAAADVDRFVATSRYYADHVASHFGIDRARIDVVYPGLPPEFLGDHRPLPTDDRAPTVGYMARICPEKGLDRLVDAMLLLRQMPGMERARLHAAGYLGAAHTAWYADLEQRIRRSPLAPDYTCLGEIDLAAKWSHLEQVDVLCVPTAYPEAKGIYVLEALARQTPVVLPHHGSFPELIEQTGGGVTVPPGNPAALANALHDLLTSPARSRELGQTGQAAIKGKFLDCHMAEGMIAVYQSALAARDQSPARVGAAASDRS